jgi:hypothetical protein
MQWYGEPVLTFEREPQKGLGRMSQINFKGFRPKAFTTCVPVSGSIQGIEKVWPGRALRKGFIGQYRFWVGQIHFHETQEFLDWGWWVSLSL